MLIPLPPAGRTTRLHATCCRCCRRHRDRRCVRSGVRTGPDPLRNAGRARSRRTYSYRYRRLPGHHKASALELLLDWQASSSDDEQSRGRLEAAVIEVERLPPRVRSFHPKAWRFESSSFGIAFVGSSNLSRSALDTGVEWNLRVDRDRDSIAYKKVRDAFDTLWRSARRLDARWIADYARRVVRSSMPPPQSELAPS